MTNHIEEMMKTSGVEKQYYSFNSADGNTYNWELNEDGNKKYNMHFIGKPDLKQRAFTAEKQMEIIKLILCSDDIDELRQYYSEILKAFVFECYSLPECGIQSSWTSENKDYSLALAELVTMLMNAGELDKSKVKEILER